eukprot:2857359-Amphidinium_carterae.1
MGHPFRRVCESALKCEPFVNEGSRETPSSVCSICTSLAPVHMFNPILLESPLSVELLFIRGEELHSNIEKSEKKVKDEQVKPQLPPKASSSTGRLLCLDVRARLPFVEAGSLADGQIKPLSKLSYVAQCLYFIQFVNQIVWRDVYWTVAYFHDVKNWDCGNSL